MSVLVKSMEMPKDGCMDCPMHKWTFAGEMCCITDEIVGGNVERGGFPTNCPLVSVPEHGRLIDADALFKRLFVGQDGQIYPNQDADGWDNTYNFRVIKHEIIMAPTIIPPSGGKENE